MAVRQLEGNALTSAITQASQRTLPSTGGGGVWGGTGTSTGTSGASTPTSTGTSSASTTAQSFSDALGSIIQTGSATPKMATLVNPDTGDRQAVAVGSQDAQSLFGQGYVLETSAPTSSSATGAGGAGTTADSSASASVSVTGTTSPVATSSGFNIDSMRADAEKLRQQAFEAVYSYTPEQWQHLPYETQVQLRNKRVMGLLAARGNLLEAIEVMKEEKKAEEDTALGKLNFYLSAGILDQISDTELSDIASQTGYSLSGLKALGEEENLYEMKSIGGDLYAIKFDPVTGEAEMNLIKAGSSGSSSGSSSTSAAEAAEAQSWLSAVLNGLSIDDVPTDYKAGVQNALAGAASLGGVEGPFLEFGGGPIPYTEEQAAAAQEILARQFSEQVESSTESERLGDDLSSGIAAIKAEQITSESAYIRLINAYPTRVEDIQTVFKENGITF